MKGNRLNNSKTYNHDYYLHNKEKWGKDKKTGKMGSALAVVGGILVSALRTAAYAALIAAGSLLVASLLNYFVSDISVVHDTTVADPEKKRKEEEAKSKKEGAFENKNPLFKYKYKVTNLLGKVRYFYTTQAYENYMKRLKQKDEPSTIKDDMAAINPGFSYDKRNNDENCAYCTLAYDMRRRGYDVSAISENDPNFEDAYTNTIESWYKGGKLTSHKVNPLSSTGKVDAKEETKRLFNELSSQGDGASGFITLSYSEKSGMSGGHAMAYQVIDGEAYVLDTQANKAYTADEFASTYAKVCNWGLASGDTSGDSKYYYVNYMRTDNLQPNPVVESKVKNVGESNSIHQYNSNDDPANLGFGDKAPELVSKEEVGGTGYGSERSKKNSGRS